jgi:hypothetical protein
MKCFYHAEKDAVGTCSECGKTACRECIEDIKGTLLCKGCMVRKLERREERREAAQASRQEIITAARKRIKVSKIIFAVVAVLSFIIGIGEAIASISDPHAPPLILFIPGVPFGSLLCAYLVWSVYWGIPAIWTRWWGMLRGIGCFLIANPITWLIIAVSLFEIPLVVGYMYGVFGGAIYEYRKCRSIAAGGE